MDTGIPIDFPEERLIRTYVTALRDATNEAEIELMIVGALQVGYRRGLLAAASPSQPEDLEEIAASFLTLANRLRIAMSARKEPETT
jgi:hypothetical protein